MPIDFDDMTNRIIDKLDILDDKIDKICLWKETMSTEWKTHMKEQDRKNRGKEKRFYYLIGLMGVAFTIFEVMKELL